MEARGEGRVVDEEAAGEEVAAGEEEDGVWMEGAGYVVGFGGGGGGLGGEGVHGAVGA